MQKNDRRPIGRTRFGVSNVQKSRIDLLQRCE